MCLTVLASSCVSSLLDIGHLSYELTHGQGIGIFTKKTSISVSKIFPKKKGRLMMNDDKKKSGLVMIMRKHCNQEILQHNGESLRQRWTTLHGLLNQTQCSNDRPSF